MLALNYWHRTIELSMWRKVQQLGLCITCVALHVLGGKTARHARKGHACPSIFFSSAYSCGLCRQFWILLGFSTTSDIAFMACTNERDMS